jgi:hypothetical protein
VAAQDNLQSLQFSYDRNIAGRVSVKGPGVDETADERLVGHGLRPASLRHPADTPEPLYHGSNADLSPGDQIEPGHAGNFVSRMSQVYATTQPEPDESYKGARGYGKNVYGVQPTGW